MKFSEYRRLREEKEQDTGVKAGVSSATEERKTSGTRFTDIMKEREPERYARMTAEKQISKQNNVSDYMNRVNQHLGYADMQAADAASYINNHKDTYTADAADNATRRRGEYDTTKQQAFALMKEAWDNQDLDTERRQQALNLLLDSVGNMQQTDKANTEFADYMGQFQNQEAFDRTKEAERKQEELKTLSVEEIQKRIQEAEDNLKTVKEQDKVSTRTMGFKALQEHMQTQSTNEMNIENDIQSYKNELYSRQQQEALDGLTDETKEAFENLYVLQNEGYNKDASNLEKVLDNLTGTSHIVVQRAYEDEAKEKATAALETQGLSKDDFDSLYEYYKFARDAENSASKEEEWNQKYENAGVLGKIGMNVGTVASTPVRGVTATQELVDSLHYQNENAPLNTNSANYILTNYTDTVRNATSQDIKNDKLNFLYQTGMSMGDMATLLPLSSVSGGASLALMGTNAGTSAAKEATLRGVSKEQALMTGLTAGAAEVVFEKLSLDNFWDIARKQGRAATRNAFLNILAQAGIEGSEEVFTDIANTFTDNLINRGLSEWYQNMDNYYKQGMSMTEAQKAATVDYCKQLGTSFLGGALSGGIFGTGAVVNTTLSGRKSNMETEDFQQVAEGIETDRASYSDQEGYDKAMEVRQLAQDLSKKENVTDFEKGLFNQATAELSNINWNEQNNPKEQIQQIAATIQNETVSRAFIADYKEGMPVETYTRAFKSFCESGYTELPFERALEANDYIASVIDKPTLYGIYCLGQNQAAELSKQYTSQEQKELVNTMANALGVKVEYQDIPGANGMYKDGTIYIANKTINPSMVVMSHELTHHLKATVSEEYASYENYVIDYFKEYHTKDYDALYHSMAEQYGNNDALIREEIAANAAETFLTDTEAVNRFVKQNRTIAEKIADFLNDFITKLKELYQNYTAKGQAGKMLAEDIEVYEQARDLWYEAVSKNIKELGENEFPTKNNSPASSTQLPKNKTTDESQHTRVQFPVRSDSNGLDGSLSDTQENGNIKFMKKQGIEDEIQRWFDSTTPEKRKKSGGNFKLGTTSEVLKSIGLDEIDVYMDHSKIQKILDTHDEMNISLIKSIPDMLENPVMITSSLSQPKTSIVIFGGDVVDGKAIMLSLLVNNGKGEITDYVVTSAYGRNKNGLVKYLNDSTYYYIDSNKNRTDSWLSALGVQFPSATIKYGSIKRIPKFMQKSNSDKKFSLKSYTDEIGLRFSDKEGGELFESIFMGTDNIDYESVLVDDGSESYRATMDLINESARILQDGIAAAGKLKDFNVTRDMAQAMATHYLNKYGATFNADTLADNLFNIFAYIQNTEDVNYQDMIRVMQEVCKPVIATSQKVDKVKMKQYTDFRKKVRSYNLRLNEAQKREIANVYGQYDNFKNANQKKYALSDYGYYLDNVWNELVEASGYALPYDTPVNEQMLELHNYMTALEKSAITPSEDMNNSQLAYDMALNIYTDYFRTSNEGNKKLVKEVKSQMKNQLDKYKRDIQRDYKKQVERHKEIVELEKQAEINRLQKQMQEMLDNEFTAMDNEVAILSSSVLNDDIVALKKKIENIKKRDSEKIADLKAKNYQSYLNRALAGKKTAHRNHIKKNMLDLQKRLANPKENKYIPQGLVRVTIELCEAVNIDTGKSEKLAEHLSEMSRLYAKMKQDTDYAIASEYDEHTQKMIERLQYIFSGRNITTLELEELQEVDELVSQLRFQIVNAGKLINMEKSKEVYDTAVKCMDEINAAKSYDLGKGFNRGLNRYTTSMLSPKRQFRRMSGYKEDSVLNQIYEDLNNGQQKQMQVLMETARIFDPVTKGEHNQKSINKLVGKEKKDWIDIGLKYKNLDPVIVPRAFRVSLAMHIQNKANLDHIIYGGLTIPEPKAYQRGDYKTAYATGTTIYFMPDNIKSVEDRQAAYNEAVKKLKSVVAEMTPYERAMVKCSEKFFHEYTGEKINETSLQLNGYKKARVHNYFPIRTDSNFNHSEIEGLVRNGTLEHLGMLNNRVGARNPILLEDITQVIKRQSENVAKYYGLAIPIRNFNKIYNTTKIGYLDSTKSTIARKWGVTGQKYIEDLLTDLQSKRSQGSTILDTLQGNFAQSVLSGNLSVAAQQIVAYPTAAATLGWKATLEGLRYVPTKLDMEHIAQYTPLLWYRNQGTGTEEIGDVNKSKDIMSTLASKATTALEHRNLSSLAKVAGGAEKVIDWNMELLQRIDTKAVGSLWKASEIYVQKTLKVFPKNGEDDYYRTVAKVFNNCIDDTQADYSTMQRPDILRNPSKAWKMIFLFKTQPLQNFNILYDSYGNFYTKAEAYKKVKGRDSKERGKIEQEYVSAKKEFGRAIASQLAAASLVFAMKLLANVVTHRMDKYRNEEDDISGWQMVEELVSEVLSNLAGSVLGGSEVYSFIDSFITGDRYYGIGVGIIDAVNDFTESLLKMKEEPSWDNLKQIYFDAGVLIGVPGENLYKFFSGIGLHLEDFSNGEPGSFKAGHETKLSVQYTTMMNALVDENTERYEERYADTLETLLLTKTEEEAKSAIVSGIKGKLKESYLEAEITYDDAMAILKKIGDEEPYFTIKAWDNSENKEYGKYSELKAAVISDQGIDEEMAELTDNGVKEDSAQEQLRNAIKEAYKEGNISAEKASEYLKRYKEDYTDDDIYWQLREWDKQDSYSGDEEYSKYDDLVSSVETGNFDSVVKEYVEHGTDATTIKRAITEQYKPLYQEAYLSGNHKTVNAIKELLNKLRVNGKRIYNQEDYLDWNKQAKKQAKEENH